MGEKEIKKLREREKEIKTGRAGGDNDGVSEYTVCI